MSTYVTDLVSRALLEIGDRNGRRTERDEMLGYFNRVQEKLATEMRCLQTDYYFDLVAGEPRYFYPMDAVQISGIRVARTNTPTSLADYYWLEEYFNDEFRIVTHGQRPLATVYAYHARPEWFELISVPTDAVVDGGIVSTWRLPTWIATETQSAVMELRDWLRGPVQEGMQILARLSGRERAAAMSDWERWVAAIDSLKEKIEDPSDDRRAAIRPPGSIDWTGGMR